MSMSTSRRGPQPVQPERRNECLPACAFPEPCCNLSTLFTAFLLTAALFTTLAPRPDVPAACSRRPVRNSLFTKIA